MDLWSGGQRAAAAAMQLALAFQLARDPPDSGDKVREGTAPQEYARQARRKTNKVCHSLVESLSYEVFRSTGNYRGGGQGDSLHISCGILIRSLTVDRTARLGRLMKWSTLYLEGPGRIVPSSNYYAHL